MAGVLSSLRRTAAPSLSPARQKLADRLAEKAEADARLAQLRGASERAWRSRREAETTRDAAAAKANEAQTVDTRALVDQFLAGQQPTVPSRSEAQAALADAEAALELAQHVRDAVDAEITELTKGASLRNVLFDNALEAVIAEAAAPAATALMTQAAVQFGALTDTLRVLLWLSHSGLPDRGPNAMDGLMEWTILARNLATFTTRFEAAPVPTLDMWKQAYERLRADATAELPQ